MKKTAKGLVAYVIAQLGKPYWFGTFGQAASKELYDQKKRQYPAKYTEPYNGTTEKVHDCAGLYKGYLWCDSHDDPTAEYQATQDISANSLFASCKEKGEMATMPDVPGVLVFYSGHMGVYIGGGEVVEARGRKYGVVKTKLTDRPWTSWGYAPDITYEASKQEETGNTVSVSLPVLKKGDKGEPVRAMQNLLLASGYEMKSGDKVYGADASFGGATRRAVEKFQVENQITVTGECDAATWKKLLGV